MRPRPTSPTRLSRMRLLSASGPGLPSGNQSPTAGGNMSENKGRGIKGRTYDVLTSVGTSSAGITGTTGNLNTGTRDGGIGMPSRGDSGYRAGNRQSADADD